ncbi:hypothetical protein ACJMK2_024412 [Sinanodonta woodiana]|uniref:Uncharacterized protein n=1 Tax=Sinanodonta woodiana TaxID=1069815 RepID=A0ABD3XFB6_SINWO
MKLKGTTIYQKMTDNTVWKFVLVIASGCGLYYVQGFECHIARDPIIITGDTIHSVNFTWDCRLMKNESVLSLVWFKDDICIAKATNGLLTPCDSYKSRVEQFETYGISINNISRNDSGHYKVVILLVGNHHEYLPCHPTYLPVLPEYRQLIKERTDLQFSKDEQSSECEQYGPSKLEIGLLCGILPLTVVIGLGGVVWYCRRKRRNANHSENENISPELSPLQISG